MSILHTADAIVLRSYPYRETSVLVSCLTDRFGKIKGLIKGLRQWPTRHRSPMEPLTLNRIVFYDHRHTSLHLISQCELLAAFASIQRDLEVARSGAFCVELIDALLEPDEPHPDIFHLVSDALERLSSGERRVATIRIHFILRLLRLAGFHPQLHECTGCTQRPDSGRAFWSVRQGGVLCERCLHQDPHAEAVAPEMLEAFLACAEADSPHRVDAANTDGIQRYLDQFLRWHLERPLKTLCASSV